MANRFTNGRPKTVRPMLSDRCLSVCPVLSVCLSVWPNGWMDQDETWHAGRPRRWPHCVRWGPNPLPKMDRASSPILRVEVENFEFGPEVGAIPVIANFVALKQQIILVKTRSE